jgi:CrcB protein
MAQTEPLSAAVAVFVGGGAGAVARWLVSQALVSPWGTAAVNVVGCFLLAVLAHPRLGVSEPWRVALGTGALGGFTTYSTFNLDVVTALRDGKPERAALIAAVTFGGCLLAGLAGWALADRLRPPG